MLNERKFGQSGRVDYTGSAMAKHNEILHSILNQIKGAENRFVRLGLVDHHGQLRSQSVHRHEFLEKKGDLKFSSDEVFHFMADEYCARITVQPDLNAFRQLPWFNAMPFFFVRYRIENSDEIVDPREALRNEVQQLKQKGYIPQLSFKISWSLFKEPYHESSQQVPAFNSAVSHIGQFENEVYDYCQRLFESLEGAEVGLKTYHIEQGPGKIAMELQLSDAVFACDSVMLLKMAAQDLAIRYGLKANFMAQTSNQEASNDLTASVSLNSAKDDSSLFFINKENRSLSSTLSYCIAGLSNSLPDWTLLYLPHVNSYKRLLAQSGLKSVRWSQTDPSALIYLRRLADSYVISQQLAGADANPYLVALACFKSCSQGLLHEKPCDHPSNWDFLPEDYESLPKDLGSASGIWSSSENTLKNFSPLFIRKMTETSQIEWENYLSSVTQWDLDRYQLILRD